MAFRLKIVVVLCALGLVILIVALFSRHDFGRVTLGMSLSDVESILGPGVRINEEELPGAKNNGNSVPVVHGDYFCYWRRGSRTLYVGLRHGKVISKHILDFDL